MSKKLQNIKAVQQMIDGKHKFQSKKITGFADAQDVANKNKHHSLGEVWEEQDASGNNFVIEQKDGYRVKKTKNAEAFNELRSELKAFPNCRKETCTCPGTHHLDKKMQIIHKMCFDCVIEMEHELKKAGKYKAYEQQKMRENAEAWLKSAEQDVALLKETYTQASQFVSSGNGDIETWKEKMTPEEFETTIQTQFNKFKENFLKQLKEKQDENN